MIEKLTDLLNQRELTTEENVKWNKIYGAAKEYNKVILENVDVTDEDFNLLYLSLANEKIRESTYFALMLVTKEK